MNSGASIYVCGDGMAMAKDVHAALLELLQTHCALDATAANDALTQMAQGGRYVRDIWS